MSKDFKFTESALDAAISQLVDIAKVQTGAFKTKLIEDPDKDKDKATLKVYVMKGQTHAIKTSRARGKELHAQTKACEDGELFEK